MTLWMRLTCTSNRVSLLTLADYGAHVFGSAHDEVVGNNLAGVNDLPIPLDTLSKEFRNLSAFYALDSFLLHGSPFLWSTFLLFSTFPAWQVTTNLLLRKPTIVFLSFPSGPWIWAYL